MKSLLSALFFSEWSAIPYSLFLIWFFAFGSVFVGGGLIEENLIGIFIICSVSAYYFVTQAFAALRHCHEVICCDKENKAWLDDKLSILPLLVLGAVLMLSSTQPEIVQPYDQWVNFTLSPFDKFAWGFAFTIVVIDIFFLGSYANKITIKIQEALVNAAQRGNQIAGGS